MSAWTESLTSGALHGQQANQSVFIPAGFQNRASGDDLRVHAARSYSLISPPRTGRRLTRSW
jgi:hypothetical protein